MSNPSIVCHCFWVDSMQTARSLQLEINSLCRHFQFAVVRDGQSTNVPPTGVTRDERAAWYEQNGYSRLLKGKHRSEISRDPLKDVSSISMIPGQKESSVGMPTWKRPSVDFAVMVRSSPWPKWPDSRECVPAARPCCGN